MRTLELTGRGLVRALSAAIAARPVVDAAARVRAEAIAAAAAEAGGEACVMRRGHGDYVVEASDARRLTQEFELRDAGCAKPAADETSPATPSRTQLSSRMHRTGRHRVWP